jgi:hypothetical protein
MATTRDNNLDLQRRKYQPSIKLLSGCWSYRVTKELRRLQCDKEPNIMLKDYASVILTVERSTELTYLFVLFNDAASTLNYKHSVAW